MNRQETIELMKFIASKKPNYFQHHSQNEKNVLLNRWMQTFPDRNLKQIRESVDFFIKKNKRVPYPEQIREMVEWRSENIDFSSPWYIFFPQEGEFYYTDKQMQEASAYVMEVTDGKEWRIPDEMRKRMHYRRDPDDTDMNYIVKEIHVIQKLDFNSDEAKQRLNKLIETYIS